MQKVIYPSVKNMPDGLVYHQFRTDYQKLLGIYHPPKEFFYRRYGEYVAYHKQQKAKLGN